MADFDEKLNQILSNPEAMAQIARLAQSLNAPVPDSGAPDVPPPQPPHTPDVPPRLPHTADAPTPDALNTDAPPKLSALPNDANSIAQFLPLLQELGGDSNARRLLYALRPYLRPQKQEKVERALHFARLFRVGKKFLSQWEE